jgi:hypothetical protein
MKRLFLTIGCLFILIGSCWGEDQPSFTIYNKQYRTQNYVSDGKIYDKNYHVQGYIRNNQIYDRNFHREGSYKQNNPNYRSGGGKNRNR